MQARLPTHMLCNRHPARLHAEDCLADLSIYMAACSAAFVRASEVQAFAVSHAQHGKQNRNMHKIIAFQLKVANEPYDLTVFLPTLAKPKA